MARALPPTEFREISIMSWSGPKQQAPPLPTGSGVPPIAVGRLKIARGPTTLFSKPRSVSEPPALKFFPEW